MSCLEDGDALEEKLNDIDEFIQSELGFAPVSAGGPLTPTEINGLGFFLQSGKISNGSNLWNNSGISKQSEHQCQTFSRV